mgnify:CR=1 FL=1
MSSPFEPAPRNYVPPLPPPPPPAPANGMFSVSEPAHVLVPATPEPALEAAPPVKKKTKRLSLDSIGTLIFSLLIVLTLLTMSFIASFNAIYESAEFTGTVAEWRWVFPVFIDLAIFGYTVNLFIFKRRKKPVKRTIAGLVFFATISVLVNFAHTVDFWGGDLSNYQAWIGVLLAVSAPIAVLLASEELGRLAFEEDDE